MIKVDKSAVTVKGIEPTVRAEFCVLCKNLREIYADRYGIEEADEMLLDDLNDSKKTADEINAEIEKLKGEHDILGEIAKLIEKLYKEGK